MDSRSRGPVRLMGVSHFGALLLGALLLGTFVSVIGACTPAAAPEPVEPEPEIQNGPGEIPWAEGERPRDPSATTREVGEQPTSVDEPMTVDDPDEGIVVADPSRCTGKAPPGLRADVQVRAQEVQACADRLPEGRDKMAGELKFSVRVAETGSVSAVEVLSDSLKQPTVLACAEEILRKPFEVPPIGGCALFVVPLSLQAERTREE